ncbi:gamma-tubulin complex component 6 [Pleurodeles waltl]|uniref:gamma-tubulin complex component 6 n=1 Tax=Pleurodeles waltl TaxID=8319 RepID=UPI0037094B17
MAGITQLFGDLCEAHMTEYSRQVCLGRRKVSKSKAKRDLKKLAYGTLFTNLFQEEVRKLQPNHSKLPVKNKILMLSFDLRVSGRGDEADRMEALVDRLEHSAGIPFTEISSVLELLVQLAGTGPPQVRPPRKDYFLNNKHVGRNPKYQGYDYYDVGMFEADISTFIVNEECQTSDTIQRTLQIMESAPGTGLPDIGFFSQNYPVTDRFEKETRVSLFGALVHSRSYDMDIKLDMPPVPDSADLSGLAIKVPQSVDQSDDEGFQSASNLTPDSQSEPSMTPDIDLWDALLTFGHSKRRCWERIGCPPGKTEEPYLTEAGREAFDTFYRLREGEVQILSIALLQPPQLVMRKEFDLVKDVLNVLIGVVSATFSFNQATQTFVAKQGIYISGTSPESMSNLLAQVAEYGTYYTRLSRFSLQPVLDSSYSKGLVFQAFTCGMRRYLQYYRACVLSTPPTLSLLTISFVFRKLGRQLRYLAELCGIGTATVGAPRGSSALFPTGVKLLSCLYKEAIANSSNEFYPVLLSLLKTCCEPYTRFIYDWVYSGVFRDVYGEFMIQVNEDFLRFRDRRYWTHGYVLISKEVEDCVPVFLNHIANEIYLCGKTINLLKLCCPGHYICWSEIPVPRISVTFSLEELKEMEKDCALYVGRVERLARYSSISKEEKDLRAEIAKQELIVEARQTASRMLDALKDRQLSNRMALDAKKREQFLKLKEQFEKDQERRLAAKQEETDEDSSYAKELAEREKQLKALEEELEARARQELIDHYSKLSEDAARKERRALWKLQRHKLETARLKFFSEDERHTQELLEQFSKGELTNEEHIVSQSAIQDNMDLSITHLGNGHSQLSSTEDQSTRHNEGTDNLKISIALESEGASDEPLIFLDSSNTIGSPESGPQNVNQSPSYKAVTTTLSNMCLLDVSIEDFLPKSALQPTTTTVHDSVVDEALQDIGSDLSNAIKGDTEDASTVQHCDYDFKTVIRPVITQLPQEHRQVGENVSDMASSRPCSNRHSHASDASIKIGEYVSNIDISQPHSNKHGHVSDSHIKVGEYNSSIEPRRPHWNLHGHVSTAHIKVGEYASDVQPTRPRWNIHGHASQANIKIGENVSDVVPSRPRWSVHGHASNSSIKIGENVSDVESSRPRWNLHGHASESHIKIGELVSDAEEAKPRWCPFGHASQSSFQTGTFSLSEEMPFKPHHKQIEGRSGNSTVQNVLYGGQSSTPRMNVPSNSTEGRKEYLQDSLPADEVLFPLPTVCTEVQDKKVVQGFESQGADILSSSPLPEKEAQNSLGEEFFNAAEQTVKSVAGPLETFWQCSSETKDGEDVDDNYKKEQDYVQSLADKYYLDKYQDTYDLMSDPPVLDLLSQVMPRPFSFPEEHYVQSATDETAVQLIELLSLPVLMKYSLTAPLASHVSLVNKAIIDYYFVALDVEKHFETLRHFLLMEDGEFAQFLSDLLFEKLGSGQTPGELLNPLVLNSILSKALQYSLQGDSQLANNLSFALKYLPEIFKPNSPDVLSCLELRYKVDWPLNIVITETCMNKYNKIFAFLMQLKYMVWALKDIYFHLKRTALVNRASSSLQFRQLQLYRHEMQHFVKVIQGYLANQILHVTWCEFRNNLSTVVNLDDIHKAHAEYLNKALFRGLLTEKALPVMNIIHGIFSLILKFRVQLISYSWNYDSVKEMVIHPNFGMMQQSYKTFKYYSYFLFEVVTKLVNRGYQPHLEDFLLRMNFNNYYKDN